VKISIAELKQLILEEINYTFDEAMSKSDKYLFDKIAEVSDIHYNNLIVELGDGTYGILAAYRHFNEGIKSKTNKPISVVWIKEEHKYLVVDGYHRLVEALLRGEQKFLCEIDWTGFTKQWSLPNSNDRLVLEDIFSQND
jgi:hypothetical protein